MTDPVPDWVHFADVPPTDEEPWELEETPAEHRRRWLSTFLLIIAFLMGLGALALAARQVFEWLGGAA